MNRKAIIPFNLVLAIFLFGTVFTIPANGGTNFCKETSKTMRSSCKPNVQSDYLLAKAKCNNISDSAAREACLNQAKTDMKDATQTCSDQYNARQAACDRLGGARYDPVIIPANFSTSTTINNPLFPLVPGTTFIYEGDTAAGHEIDNFFVTHNTKVIQGVTCVEVRDTSKIDGELIEDTLDWFAQDNDGNVWYFGENAKQLSDGLIVGVEGSWTAGIDGAKPGIIMKAHPAIGDFYRQEFSLDTAEDIAEVISLTEPFTIPFAPFTTFNDCLKTEETSPLEPDTLENKIYCAGFGNVFTHDITAGETLPLVNITTEP